MTNQGGKKKLSSVTYGINEVPKSGTDAHGRLICNGLLYSHTAQLSGVSDEMVEQIINFTGKYVAASVESDLNLDVMIPGFGKFKTDTKKKFKREKKMMEYSTSRIVNKDALARFKQMQENGETSTLGNKFTTTKKKEPIIIGPYIHTIQALKLYRMGAMTKENIERIFGKDPEIWEQMEIELKKIDDYKALKK